jgi:hypothetical protein
MSASGRFAIRDVAMREIGISQLARTLLPHLPPLAPNPRELARLARRALNILRAAAPARWRNASSPSTTTRPTTSPGSRATTRSPTRIARAFAVTSLR